MIEQLYWFIIISAVISDVIMQPIDIKTMVTKVLGDKVSLQYLFFTRNCAMIRALICQKDVVVFSGNEKVIIRGPCQNICHPPPSPNLGHRAIVDFLLMVNQTEQIRKGWRLKNRAVAASKRERRNWRLGGGVKTFLRCQMRARTIDQSMHECYQHMKMYPTESTLELDYIRTRVSYSHRESFSVSWALILPLK